MSSLFGLGGQFPPKGNFFDSAKDYAARGGFVNGMNLSLTGNVWYVAGNDDDTLGVVGNDGNNGRSPYTPFRTMGRAFEFVERYGSNMGNMPGVNAVIVGWGLIREQLTLPNIKNVMILGGGYANPYQGTDSGVYNGAGCLTWLAPTSPTASTPLLTIVSQGCKVLNTMFGTVASTPSLRLKGLETTEFPDASHAIVDGCYFATQGGLAESGIGGWNLFKCRFTNNYFLGLTGTAILGEDVSIRTPASNVIDSNFFRACANAIDMPMNYGVINNNRLKDITTKQIDINVGADNYVGINFFDKTQANISIAEGFIGNATDIWRNYSSDTAALTVGVPA